MRIYLKSDVFKILIFKFASLSESKEMKQIKIYSERNTGSLYLEWLVKNNFKTKVIDTFELGWKHRLAPSAEELGPELKQDVLYLCLVKNPYSWVMSMHKRPFQHEVLKELRFSEFLKYSYGDYKNPITMWNIKNNSYVKMSEYVNHHEVIKYEDLLQNPNEILMNISEKYNFNINGIFRNVNNLLTHKHGMTKRSFHKDHYIREEWIRKLQPKHIALINLQLDKELMQKLNYKYL
jgi:hypothetical protein